MKRDIKRNTSPLTGEGDEIQPALEYGAAANSPDAASRAVAGANHGSI
jgi:hypothetical protein